MKSILITIFITLFSLILLNSIYLKISCNRTIEGLEQDDTDLDVKDRFKKLQNRVNKIQDQIEEAEKTNKDNAESLKKLKSN
jgi:peptidoglycan hydrolase CwlO-like protein